MVLIDFEVIGDDAKLLARHFENVVLIDAQRRTHRFGGAGKGAPKSGICACCPVSSNRIRGGNCGYDGVWGGLVIGLGQLTIPKPPQERHGDNRRLMPFLPNLPAWGVGWCLRLGGAS